MYTMCISSRIYIVALKMLMTSVHLLFLISLHAAVQPQLSNQGMVSSHMNYLPGTPSPTFPGLQPSILQSSGEENFQIDFLHESDVRGIYCSIEGINSSYTHAPQSLRIL